MKKLFIILSILMTANTVFGQMKIGKLKSTTWGDVPGSMVPGYTSSFLTKADMDDDKKMVFLEYSRHYDSPDADTMFARMNINGVDVDFKPSAIKAYDYVSLKGGYKLKTKSLSGKKTRITVYKNKETKSVDVLASNHSG